MAEQNHLLTHRWFEEVWNQGRLETIDELFDPEGKSFDYPTAGNAAGPEEFKEGVRALRALFPDIKVKVEDTICEGDKVVTRWSANFTHSGEGLGTPTGKPFALNGISISQWRDGRILYGWNAQDLTTIFNQLK